MTAAAGAGYEVPQYRSTGFLVQGHDSRGHGATIADGAEPGVIGADGWPVYITVGDADPVNGQLALVHALADRYRAADLTDVELRTYPGARHEVFNETNRGEVEADLLAWLERVVAARGQVPSDRRR